jgi:hypothetical protein
VSNGTGFNLVSSAGPTIIGTIAGDGTNNVRVEFSASASATDVQNLLQGATLTTTSALGNHNVAISLTDGDYVSINETVAISLVGDFTNATSNGVTTNTGDAANNALSFATIAAATSAAPVVLTGNTYVSLTGTYGAVDIDALLASDALNVSSAAVVRLVATANSNISAVENISSLGAAVSLFAVNAGATVSMDVDQALGVVCN